MSRKLFCKILIPPIFGVLLFWFGQTTNTIDPPLPLLNQHPQKNRGRRLAIGYLHVRKILDSQRFQCKVWGKKALFLRPNHNLRKGEFISIHAIYLGPSRFQVIDVTKHPHRRWKRWIGMLSVLFIGIFFGWPIFLRVLKGRDKPLPV